MKSTASASQMDEYSRQAQVREARQSFSTPCCPSSKKSSSMTEKAEKDTEKTERGGPKLLRTSVGAEEIARW